MNKLLLQDITDFERWQADELRLDFMDNETAILAQLDGALTLGEIEAEAAAQELWMEQQAEKAWSSYYEYDAEAQEQMYWEDMKGYT